MKQKREIKAKERTITEKGGKKRQGRQGEALTSSNLLLLIRMKATMSISPIAAPFPSIFQIYLL